MQISKFWKEQYVKTDPKNNCNYFQSNQVETVGQVASWIKSWRTTDVDTRRQTPDDGQISIRKTSAD